MASTDRGSTVCGHAAWRVPIAARPPRAVSPAPTTAPTSAPTAAVRAPSAPRFELREWAVERQADILLYVGAFLLVIAALIFVSSQGTTFSGAARVALLAGYTAGFIAAGLLVKRWERVREAGRVFLALGALLTPLNFLLVHVELLDQRGVAPETVWLAASVYGTAFYGALATGGYGRLYALPATVALFSAWAALFAVLDLPGHWFGAWWMAAATAITAAAAGLRRLSIALVVGASVLAVLSLLGAHVAAEFADHPRAQVPVAYALLSVGIVIVGWRWREPIVLLVATTTVVGAAVAALWAAGASSEWYAYPVLVAGALIVGARPLWSEWSRNVAAAGWAYAGGCAVIPLLFTESFVVGASAALSWHGAVAHLAGAGLLAAVAWRNRTDGLTSGWDRLTTTLAERVLFGWAAFAMLLVAIAYAQDALDVARPHSGWAFAAIGAATAAALAATARRDERAVWALLPPLLATTAVSLQPWERFPGHDAVLLSLPAAQVAAGFAWTRRWTLAAATLALAGAAMAATWAAVDWPLWTLGAAYGVAGVALFALLDPQRRARPAWPQSLDDAWVFAMSWAMAVAAPAAAAIALDRRVDAGAAVAAETVEYRALVVLILVVAGLIAVEGQRLRLWSVEVAALAVAGAAVAMAWPVFDWPTWTLAATYATAGVAIFLAVTPWRRYGSRLEPAATVALSWGGVAAGLAVAQVVLTERIEGGAAAAATVEYRTLTLLVLLLAPMIAFEAGRLRRPWATIPASSAAMVALVMAIAIAEPTNVQAYTVPVSIYLGAVGSGGAPVRAGGAETPDVARGRAGRRHGDARAPAGRAGLRSRRFDLGAGDARRRWRVRRHLSPASSSLARRLRRAHDLRCGDPHARREQRRDSVLAHAQRGGLPAAGRRRVAASPARAVGARTVGKHAVVGARIARRARGGRGDPGRGPAGGRRAGPGRRRRRLMNVRWPASVRGPGGGATSRADGYVSDRTADGRRLRSLTIVDQYTPGVVCEM